MKSCRVAAKGLGLNRLGLNRPATKRLAVSVHHAVVRDEAADVVRKTVNLVKQNQRNVRVVSQHGSRSQDENLDHRGKLRQHGRLDHHGNLRQLKILSHRGSPGQLENLDRLLQVTKVKTVVARGLHLSPLNFRTFRPGKKRSAVLQFERHLKSTHVELKLAVGATADAHHNAETDSISRAVEDGTFV